jgi:hypothetical protein
MTRSSFQTLATVAVVLATTLGLNAQSEVGSMEQQVSYCTVMVEGISIFYREAGPIAVSESRIVGRNQMVVICKPRQQRLKHPR